MQSKKKVKRNENISRLSLNGRKSSPADFAELIAAVSDEIHWDLVQIVAGP